MAENEIKEVIPETYKMIVKGINSIYNTSNVNNIINNFKSLKEQKNMLEGNEYITVKDVLRNEIIDITQNELEAICVQRIATQENMNNSGISSYLIDKNLNAEDIIERKRITGKKYFIIMQDDEPFLIIKDEENAKAICEMKNKVNKEIDSLSDVEYTYKKVGCIDKEL